MKLRFYCDIYPGQQPPGGYFAHTAPSCRGPNCKRFAFDVAIPDHMIFEPDFTAPEVGKVELVSDQEADS